MILIIESQEVVSGTEDKMNVPIGTKTIYWSWQGEKMDNGDYSAFGVIGKGLTINGSITDLLRMVGEK